MREITSPRRYVHRERERIREDGRYRERENEPEEGRYIEREDGKYRQTRW